MFCTICGTVHLSEMACGGTPTFKPTGSTTLAIELNAVRSERDELRIRNTELRVELNAAIEQLRVEEKQLDRALSELADARKDTERLDWLETERIREQEYLDGKRQWTGPALFRQNMLITRNIIDAARAATDTSLKDKR